MLFTLEHGNVNVPKLSLIVLLFKYRDATTLCPALKQIHYWRETMARLELRLSTNVEGEFYVDSRCINCDACRQLAPDVFGEKNGYSHVKKQPTTEEERREAFRALLSCPVQAIGTESGDLGRQYKDDFPLLLEENVYYLGFNSSKSYGANSYFVNDVNGNWMIDSPRYHEHLVRKIRDVGGLEYIFLTHQDDVADADKYADIFGARVIIHQDDSMAYPDADILIRGIEPVEIERNVLVIPVPGHTKGHCVLLYKNKYLFTGDHLEWRRQLGELRAFRNYCWYSWEEQIKSMERLSQFQFEWILPGHGQRVKLAPKVMKEKMKRLLEWMKSVQ